MMKELTCYLCQVKFQVPDELYERRMGDGKNFYCPNGHSQCFTESTVTKLQRELTQTNATLQSYQTSFEYQKGRAEKDERSNAALRAVITRFKNQRKANARRNRKN